MIGLSGRGTLVTGASGYLASALVPLLQKEGARVRCLSRRKTAPSHVPDSVEWLSGDPTNSETWPSLLDDVDCIFHLAAQTSLYKAQTDPVEDWWINVLPLLHIVDECRRDNRARTIIFTGTVTEAGMQGGMPPGHEDRPATIYDLHKLQCERILALATRSGWVHGVTLRLPNLFGPGAPSSSPDRGVLNMMIRRAVQGEPLTIYGTGNQIRDFLFVEDAVQALIRASEVAAELGPSMFVIGTGEGRSVQEAFRTVAAEVARITGSVPPVLNVSPPSDVLPIEFRDYVADPSLFRAATGWRHTVKFVEGVRTTVRAALQAGSDSPPVQGAGR